MILKRSDRFRWTWIVAQMIDKQWKQIYIGKDHLFIYFKNNNTGR